MGQKSPDTCGHSLTFCTLVNLLICESFLCVASTCRQVAPLNILPAEFVLEIFTYLASQSSQHPSLPPTSLSASPFSLNTLPRKPRKPFRWFAWDPNRKVRTSVIHPNLFSLSLSASARLVKWQSCGFRVFPKASLSWQSTNLCSSVLRYHAI